MRPYALRVPDKYGVAVRRRLSTSRRSPLPLPAPVVVAIVFVVVCSGHGYRGGWFGEWMQRATVDQSLVPNKIVVPRRVDGMAQVEATPAQFALDAAYHCITRPPGRG